jgi:phosphatidylserine/phosphatidylglycerophosphate/cardiolipin synthase-like enzyme
MDSSGTTRPDRVADRGPRTRVHHRRRRRGAHWVALAIAAVALAGYAAAASKPEASGPLRLVVEPQAGGSGPFVKLIDRARRRVELTMYELSDPAVESALAAAEHRGVAVRVLLNGGYYSHRDGKNAAAHAYLVGHGVPVRYASTAFAFTHQKTLTVDGTVSAVMTLNFTSVYYASDRDFAVLDSQPADIAAIEAVFDADWRSRSITPSRGTGDLLWSPGAGPALLHLIASAHHGLEVENEELADDDVISALCAAARDGVDVRLVMTYATEWKPALAQLGQCGAHVRLYHGEHPIYVHAKLIVADGRRAFVGSQNFSVTSLERNRELGIVTRDASIVRALSSTFESDYTGATPG